MNFHLNSSTRAHGGKIELYRIRLLARLCVALICLVQFLSRIITIFRVIKYTSGSRIFALIGFSFAPVMAVIVGIEYFLFKKRGARVLKYSHIFDLIVLLLFMGDWIISCFTPLKYAPGTDPVLFPIATVYAFVTFGWRTLLVILIVQNWQLKIIAPIAAIITMTVITIYYDSTGFYFTLIRSGCQIFYIVFIIYCEDKIKWMMIWNNIQQEKWMQVNNFILNNIPENIMILDIKGEAKFISDYCKSFIDKFSLDAKELFNNIKDLQQQEQENESESQDRQTENVPMQIARLTTDDVMLTETVNQQNNTNWLKVELLTELITNFKIVIAEKNLQEKQFLIYNGKLGIENHQQDRSIEIKISFIQQLDNEYIILILRDTTQRDLLVTLQETNKYKDQLLASVSHELRTPLNGNINLVEAAVNSEKVPENVKETLLTPALRSSKFLLHLINDILDMSQIKEKKLRLTFRSANLKETLKSTAQLVELQAKKKGIELLLELDPQLPRNFNTDHVRVSQIILNLLNNALKFTKEGAVKLIAEPLTDHPDWVKITIEDSGIGMSPENVKKLFSSYTHIEFEGRQEINPTGVGLGLNIAYNLVQLLGPEGNNTINVESSPNQGSNFSFILENRQNDLPPVHPKGCDDLETSENSFKVPYELSEDFRLKLQSKLQLQGSSSISLPGKSELEPLLDVCSCPKILVVDDNPFNTMAFETILSSLDMKCDSVYSGSSAIEKLLQRETKKCGKDCKRYSVVFLDQEMPEMNGIETVREIRRFQRENMLQQDMKIIGCTAHQSKDEIDRFLEAGLDKCIHKPISAAMIADIV